MQNQTYELIIYAFYRCRFKLVPILLVDKDYTNSKGWKDFTAIARDD